MRDHQEPQSGVYVRLLVPRRDRTGKVEYHAETHFLRLPLRREDRLELKEKLAR